MAAHKTAGSVRHSPHESHPRSVKSIRSGNAATASRAVSSAVAGGEAPCGADDLGKPSFAIRRGRAGEGGLVALAAGPEVVDLLPKLAVLFPGQIALLLKGLGCLLGGQHLLEGLVLEAALELGDAPFANGFPVEVLDVVDAQHALPEVDVLGERASQHVDHVVLAVLADGGSGDEPMARVVKGLVYARLRCVDTDRATEAGKA